MPGPLTLELRIRWSDLDGFRHVYHASYVDYLSEARDAFLLDHAGDALDRFVVRRLEVDYVGQLVHEDGTAVVEVRLEGLGTSSVRTLESVRAGSDGRLVVECRAVCVHCDDERTRSEPIPDDLRARFLRGLDAT